MDELIPGLTPLWVISFKNLESSEQLAGNNASKKDPILPLVEAARDCLEQAEQIQDELKNLEQLIDEFQDFLKRPPEE